MWQGIEIEGSANLDQSPANQGMVIINPGGWIRNARTGIRNHLRNAQGEVMWNTTGGIIQANGGNFRDNRKNVAFLSYHGTGNTLNNSYFNDTRFLDKYFCDFFGIKCVELGPKEEVFFVVLY